MDDVFGCQVPPEDLISHKCSVLLQFKFSSLISGYNVEVKGRAIVGWVQVNNGQLDDAGANWLVFLGQ